MQDLHIIIVEHWIMKQYIFVNKLISNVYTNISKYLKGDGHLILNPKKNIFTKEKRYKESNVSTEDSTCFFDPNFFSSVFSNNW